jgi:hypothetical protein
MADKYPKLLTRVGTLKYPKLNNPDTKGEFADGKYKTEIVFSPADHAAFDKEIKALAKELLPSLKNPQLPIKKDKKTGELSFIAKSKFKPLLKDSQRKEIPEDVIVKGGSQARLALCVFPYQKGLSLQLSAVQVVKLVAGGADPFDIIDDGYVAETTEQDDAPAAEAGAETSALDL